MKFFDLFSGIGGFHLGMEQAGHKCVGACEVDKHARQIYTKHFPKTKIWNDATKINPEEIPNFDCLCAGFPCQTFSLAGNRFGFKESRGTLFFEIARIAGQKKPRFLFLENVRGLLSHDRGKTFGTILATLDELGYDAQWQVLNSKYFVPQNRERIFIIGYLRGTPRPKIFPIKESYEGNSITRSKTQGKGERIQNKISGTIDANYFKGHATRTMIHRKSTKGIRRLTPLECERLQGFPDDFTIGPPNYERYRCLGNAVTVPVIKYIAKRFIKKQ